MSNKHAVWMDGATLHTMFFLRQVWIQKVFLLGIPLFDGSTR